MKAQNLGPSEAAKVLESAQKRREIDQIRANLLEIPQFAQAIGVTVRHCHRMWSEGIGPRQTRLGGRVYVRLDETKRWLEERTR